MKTINKILLIQPRHIYAPDFTECLDGHIYLPSSLITISSFIHDLGITVNFLDENIEPIKELPKVVGINLLGAPYIPVVKRFEQRLSEKYGNDYILFIGGQIVNGLSKKDFTRLFSKNVVNGNELQNLLDFFNIKKPSKAITQISHIPIYETLPAGYLKNYLSREIGFYLSQGCKFSCTFCSATRTKVINGKKAVVAEQYRDIQIVLYDLEYLILKAIEFKYDKLDIYLSNLDLFQTPGKLNEFALGVINLSKKHRFKLILRALATVTSFLKTHYNNSDIVKNIQQAGLVQVGFGIDGATAEVYKATKKPQDVQKCLDAIRILKETYNIVPETLMVFGHNSSENEISLKKALEFCKDMQIKYQALPRPHIAKDIVPGNDGWNDLKNAKIKEEYFNNIELFQNLDFTALPSPITHPDKDFRQIVSKYYIEICNISGSLTQYVLPFNKKMTTKEKLEIIEFNKKKYDL